MRWTIPGAGTVISALDGTLAPVLLVGLPLALLALTELRNRRHPMRGAKNPA